MSLINKFIASEKQKLKGYSLKEIREYVWEYYKGIIIGSVIALVILISILSTVLGAKEIAISGVLLNCYQFDDGQATLFDDYPEYAGLDPDTYEFGFNASQYLLGDDSTNDINTMQALMVGVGAGNTDFFTADWKTMEALCYQSEFLVDLHTVLPEETLEALSDRLYYADNSILTQIQESEQWIEDLQIPDPKQPESMEDPFPVAIDLQGCEKLSEIYFIEDTGTCFAFVCTSKNTDNTVAFLNYLLES